MDGTPDGWQNADFDLDDSDGDGVFTGVVPLYAGEAKIRANDAWDINWGATDFPAGTATRGGPNIPVNANGVYYVSFNSITGEYSFTLFNSIGLIGNGTTGDDTGWGQDIDMTADANDPAIYTMTGQTLFDGNVKFRADDDWTHDWGGADGNLVYKGGDIPVTAGTYDITVNFRDKTYSFN
jgi:hypothetical protein